MVFLNLLYQNAHNTCVLAKELSRSLQLFLQLQLVLSSKADISWPQTLKDTIYALWNDGCHQKWSSSSLHTSSSSSEHFQAQLSGNTALEKVENSFLVGIKKTLPWGQWRHILPGSWVLLGDMGRNGIFSRNPGFYWETWSLNCSFSALSDPLPDLVPLHSFFLHPQCPSISSIFISWSFAGRDVRGTLSLVSLYNGSETQNKNLSGVSISSETCMSSESSMRNQWVIQNPFQRKYRKKNWKLIKLYKSDCVSEKHICEKLQKKNQKSILKVLLREELAELHTAVIKNSKRPQSLPGMNKGHKCLGNGETAVFSACQKVGNAHQASL